VRGAEVEVPNFEGVVAEVSFDEGVGGATAEAVAAATVARGGAGGDGGGGVSSARAVSFSFSLHSLSSAAAGAGGGCFLCGAVVTIVAAAVVEDGFMVSGLSSSFAGSGFSVDCAEVEAGSGSASFFFCAVVGLAPREIADWKVETDEATREAVVRAGARGGNKAAEGGIGDSW
jgi:hypothetical protein